MVCLSSCISQLEGNPLAEAESIMVAISRFVSIYKTGNLSFLLSLNRQVASLYSLMGAEL